jgi:predicted kinase
VRVVSQLVSDLQRLTDGLGELPEPVVRPPFVVVSGLPGTGKSCFCARLAERLPFVILESDALRKTLFSPPIYSPEESARLFRTLHLLIERLLEKGVPLILDATNLSERDRERLYNIADRLDARLILVRMEAPPELVYKRLEARKNGEAAGNSDADWAVYRKMKPTVEKISRRHYVADSLRDITPVLDKVVREASR